MATDVTYKIKLELDQAQAKKVADQISRTQSGSGRGGSSKSRISEETSELKRQVQTTRQLETQLRAVARIKGVNSKETKKLQKSLVQESQTLQVLRKSYQQTATGLDLNEREMDEFRKSVTQADVALARNITNLDKLAMQQRALTQATGGTTNAMAGMSKSSSTANQVLFGLSDTIQDSAQFQMGMAQGFRAIGNNVSFVAELIAVQSSRINAATGKTLGFRGAVKSLGSSILGVGGVLFAINIAITAITVLSERMGKSKKNSEELNSAISELSSFYNDLSNAINSSTQSLAKQELQRNQNLQLSAKIAKRFRDEQGEVVQGLKDEIEQIDKWRQSAEGRAEKGSDFYQEQIDRSKVLKNSLKVEEEELSKQQGAYEKINEELLTSDKRLKIIRKENQAVTESASAVVVQRKLEGETVFEVNKQLLRGVMLESQRREKIQASVRALESLKNAMPERAFGAADDPIVAGSIRALRAEIKGLEAGLENVVIGSQEYEEILEKINGLKGKLNDNLTISYANESVKALGVVANALSEVNRREQQNINIKRRRVSQDLRAGRISEQQAQKRLARLDAEAKKRFNNQKKLDIASATTSAYTAFSAALADKEVPPGVRALRAGSILVAALAKVEAIRRTEFGSTGASTSVPTISSGAGAGFNESNVQPPNANFVSNSQSLSQPIQIILTGDFDDEALSVRAERGAKQRRSKAIKV